MVVDIALYEVNKPFVIDWYDTKGDVNSTIAIMASTTMVPAIVCAYWLGAHTGWIPETIKAVKTLQDFYDYSEVRNKPPGSPL